MSARVGTETVSLTLTRGRNLGSCTEPHSWETLRGFPPRATRFRVLGETLDSRERPF